MADPVLRLDSTRVSVEPGGQAQVVVTVASASSIVEGFQLTLLGDEPSRWAEVVPPTVNVFPGEEASAVVVFSPPSGSAAPSGVFAFGVRARSTESADVGAVVEGDVQLGQVSGLQAKIIPVTSSGRWRGRHVIQLSNWGNASANLRLVASDPDAALGFYLRPDVVDLPVGGSASVRLLVRTRRPFLRGTPTRLPFQVVGEPVGAAPGPTAATPYGDPSRPVVDAALNQKPILSKAFVTLVSLVLVGAVAAGAWALTRPKGAPSSLSKLGTPSKPTDVEIVTADSSSIRIKWTPIDQIDAYRLEFVDPADKSSVLGGDDVDSSQSTTVVKDLEPASEHCFQLRAIRADLRGPASEVVCGRTAEATTTASPTPPATGSPSPSAAQSSGSTPDASPSGGSSGAAAPLGGGKWVLLARSFPVRTGGFADQSDAVVAKLIAVGVTNAVTVDSTLFPAFALEGGTTLKEPSFLTLVGPYDSAALAAAACPKVLQVAGNRCDVARPAPA